jgi:hypothetical protein
VYLLELSCVHSGAIVVQGPQHGRHLVARVTYVAQITNRAGALTTSAKVSEEPTAVFNVSVAVWKPSGTLSRYTFIGGGMTKVGKGGGGTAKLSIRKPHFR